MLKRTKNRQTLINPGPLKHALKKTLYLLAQNERKDTHDSGQLFRECGGEQPKPPTFALATEIHRAIDLSCRACGAMAMGAGLGFPVGVSAPLRFHPQSPTIVGEALKRERKGALTCTLDRYSFSIWTLNFVAGTNYGKTVRLAHTLETKENVKSSASGAETRKQIQSSLDIHPRIHLRNFWIRN